MICGSEEMTFELKQMFEDLGSIEGSTKVQGGFVIEKAFLKNKMIKLVYFDFNFWKFDILRLCLSYSKSLIFLKE